MVLEPDRKTEVKVDNDIQATTGILVTASKYNRAWNLDKSKLGNTLARQLSPSNTSSYKLRTIS